MIERGGEVSLAPGQHEPPVFVVSIGVTNPRVQEEIAGEDVDGGLDPTRSRPINRHGNVRCTNDTPDGIDRVLTRANIAAPFLRIRWITHRQKLVAVNEVESVRSEASRHDARAPAPLS